MVNHLPTGPSLGIGITPDLATGPTNLFFDDGLAIGPSENGPTRYVENTFSWTDAVSWTRGDTTGSSERDSHRTRKIWSTTTTPTENSIFIRVADGSGNPYADFLLGAAGGYFQGALAPSNVRSKSTYVFGQDEWHASKNLVLTLGLRYEYSTPKSDTQGRSFSVIPGRAVPALYQCPFGDGLPG